MWVCFVFFNLPSPVNPALIEPLLIKLPALIQQILDTQAKLEYSYRPGIPGEISGKPRDPRKNRRFSDKNFGSSRFPVSKKSEISKNFLWNKSLHPRRPEGEFPAPKIPGNVGSGTGTGIFRLHVASMVTNIFKISWIQCCIGWRRKTIRPKWQSMCRPDCRILCIQASNEYIKFAHFKNYWLCTKLLQRLWVKIACCHLMPKSFFSKLIAQQDLSTGTCARDKTIKVVSMILFLPDDV